MPARRLRLRLLRLVYCLLHTESLNAFKLSAAIAEIRLSLILCMHALRWEGSLACTNILLPSRVTGSSNSQLKPLVDTMTERE